MQSQNAISADLIIALIIEAGAIESLNYDAPDLGETFADAGTRIDLITGDIISTALAVDGTTGALSVRGNVSAPQFELLDTSDFDRIVWGQFGADEYWGFRYDDPVYTDPDTGSFLFFEDSAIPVWATSTGVRLFAQAEDIDTRSYLRAAASNLGSNTSTFDLAVVHANGPGANLTATAGATGASLNIDVTSGSLNIDTTANITLDAAGSLFLEAGAAGSAFLTGGNLFLVAGSGSGDIEVNALDIVCGVQATDGIKLYDINAAANIGNRLAFYESSGSARMGYVGFASNDDLYLRHEWGTGTLFVQADNGTLSFRSLLAPLAELPDGTNVGRLRALFVVDDVSSSTLTLTTTRTLIPGISVTVDLPRAGFYDITTTFDFDCTATGGGAQFGMLRIDGTDLPAQAIFAPTAASQRATVSQRYIGALAAGSHTFEMRAAKTAAGGTARALATHTTLQGLCWA